MRKTREPLKKSRDTKGTFHAKVVTIKDRNDLTEAEDFKKTWKEYTEELHRQVLNDLDNHEDVVNHLEPDNPECEVKLALGSITQIKLVEVMEI